GRSRRPSSSPIWRSWAIPSGPPEAGFRLAHTIAFRVARKRIALLLGNGVISVAFRGCGILASIGAFLVRRVVCLCGFHFDLGVRLGGDLDRFRLLHADALDVA